MYTVEKVEENIVKLENREKGLFFDVSKDDLPTNVKEGDILDFMDGKYVINEDITKNKKIEIRNKFDSLMK